MLNINFKVKKIAAIRYSYELSCTCRFIHLKFNKILGHF